MMLLFRSDKVASCLSSGDKNTVRIRPIRQHFSRGFQLSLGQAGEHRHSLECRSRRGNFHPQFAGEQTPTGSARGVVEVFQPAQVLSFASPLFLSHRESWKLPGGRAIGNFREGSLQNF